MLTSTKKNGIPPILPFGCYLSGITVMVMKESLKSSTIKLKLDKFISL